ncbi:MAG: hypothetical protein V1845_00705, partial [bacterium]
DTLTISGLGFTSFSQVNAAAVALQVFKDGYTDIVSDANDSKTVVIKGKMAEAIHTAGQETNKFDISNAEISDSNLFRFKLTPTGEDTTISNLTVSLSNVHGFTTGNITNAKLYRDYDGNGVVDVGDDQVGDSGSPNISDSNGTIAFSSPFSATTTLNYILKASVASINSGDEMTFGLSASNIVLTGATSLVSITSGGSLVGASHSKIGGFGAGQSIGGAPPPGTPMTQGLPNLPGEEIGGEAGFIAPSSLGTVQNNWTDATYAYVSDNNYATRTGTDSGQDYGGFSFNIPAGNTIDGIEVKIEALGDPAGGTIQAALSSNTGTAVTETKATDTLTTSDVVYRLGGSANLWGRAWVISDFGNDFRLRIIAQPTGTTVKVDAVQVRVYYHISGDGGSGGGGIIYAPPARSSRFASIFESVKTAIESSVNFLISHFLASL